MTASGLIAELQKMPPTAPVVYVWDGSARSNANAVWLSRNGRVVLVDVTSQADDEDDWPTGIATRQQLLVAMNAAPVMARTLIAVHLRIIALLRRKPDADVMVIRPHGPLPTLNAYAEP